ncbi:MAG: imidazolonepropionase [Chlamydiales bacterium]
MLLIGPINAVVTLRNLPLNGPIENHAIEIIPEGGILIEGHLIKEVDTFDSLKSKAKTIASVERPCVALPGAIDCHTHICWAGNRSDEYIDKLSGMDYETIAKKGGGIRKTVSSVREAPRELLLQILLSHIDRLIANGITTCEVKSGYGLSVEDELKMLQVIQRAASLKPIDLVSTCLAAHIKPDDWKSPEDYLNHIAKQLLPLIKKNGLSYRIDAFVDRNGFEPAHAHPYLQAAKEMGFSITLHAEQFSSGGCALAAELGAVSADHLEVATAADAQTLAKHQVSAVVLPGASLGLGIPFAPARMLLDNGCSVAIASDWNPGSAPMGDLWIQACLLSAYEKLSAAELFAGVTFRAAHALGMSDRGRIVKNQRADLVFFPTEHYQDVLYFQGTLKPSSTWFEGEPLYGLRSIHPSSG